MFDGKSLTGWRNYQRNEAVSNWQVTNGAITLTKDGSGDLITEKQYAEFEQSLQQPAAVFNRLRSLVLAAYFCSEAGSREIGYQGNIAISGDYPGPTEKAKAHHDGILDELGLSEYAYQP